MGCADCELRTTLDGRDVHVRVWFDHLRELGWSSVRNCLLYQCRTCLALWELGAYEKAAVPISLEEGRIHYPEADIHDALPASGLPPVGERIAGRQQAGIDPATDDVLASERSAMTVNERLWSAGLMSEFDAAARDRDRFPDHFSDRAAGYAEHRPRYPRAVAGLLANSALASGSADREHAGTAWEAGCGSGQLSTVLGDCFARVIATDASEAQLARALPHPRVEYRLASAEASGLPDDSADAAVAAQAAHWFDLPRYYDEVRRVVRPGGIIALVSYGVLHTGSPVDELIADLHDRVLAPWWAPERRHIVDGYRSIAFPFDELPVPPIEMHALWSLERLLGYIATWSAVRAMEKKEGRGAIEAFEVRVRERWGASDEPRTVRWPLGIRLGRVAG